MSTFNISQMLGMIGMTITRTQVKVSAVFDRRTGDGQYGPYSFQDGKIEDATGSMKITFSNLPDQRSLAGRTMVFKSMETKKGLHGLLVKSKEYKGKPDISLVVSKVALIVGTEEESSVSQVEPSTRMPQNEPDRPQEEVSPKMEHEARKLGIATAKNRLTQLAGLYDLCWKTVSSMDAYKDLDEVEMNTELHKDIATTLFIQSVREGLADKCPVRTIEKFYGKEGVQDHKEEENQEEPADSNIPF